MVFTTNIFLFYFLPLFLAVYFALPRAWRNLWITLGSYVFYGWWQPWFVFLMLFTTVMDFIWGKVITRPGATNAQRKLAVAACVVTNLSFLGFFKYYMFAADTLNQLRALVGAEPFHVMTVILPIGISFYTFHSLTYIIDCYRGDAKPAKSFTDYSAFIALFPDLVAGPIIRYKTLAEQLAFRTNTLSCFSSGVFIFMIGFAKKILLANPMGHVADAAFGATNPLPLDAWVGVLAYAFQIYFDFCGYSDMAVGLGRMLGFELIKNFNAPYRADSITDLWRRWHISLSTVLRDYLYFPLGGNRKGARRTYVNLAIVMLLGGLWHGASWNFVVWGAYHGSLLAYERWRGKRSLYERFPHALQIGLTFLLMLFSWVLFRADNLTDAWHYYGSMFGLLPAAQTAPLLAATIYTPYRLLVLGICAVLAFQPLQAHDWALGPWSKAAAQPGDAALGLLHGPSPVNWPRVAVAFPLFILAVMTMYSQAFNPFIYFRF